jgi:hypothetical protein
LKASPGQVIRETLSGKKPITKKRADGVAQVVRTSVRPRIQTLVLPRKNKGKETQLRKGKGSEERGKTEGQR